VDHFCQPVWEWFIEAAYLAGLLKIPNYYADPDRFTAVRWLANGWEWIDPEKEVKANEEAIKSGQLTLEETCGARGRDWREVLDQRAREQEYAASLGLTLDFGSMASNNNGTEGGDDDEEGNGDGGNEGGNGEEA
jgi:capsid protein